MAFRPTRLATVPGANASLPAVEGVAPRARCSLAELRPQPHRPFISRRDFTRISNCAGDGVVYFVQQGDSNGSPVKIGYSRWRSLRARLAAIQTSSPFRIRLLGIWPGTRELESRFHEHFSHLRMQGEWFRPDHELLVAGRKVVAEEPCPMCGALLWLAPVVKDSPDMRACLSALAPDWVLVDAQ